MNEMLNLLNFLSFMILISSFTLIANKRIQSYIRTFRIQSLILSLLALTIAFYEAHYEILVVFALIIAIKVIFIPGKLQRTLRDIEVKVEKDFFINIPLSILICSIIVLVTYFMISSIPDLEDSFTRISLINSISVTLIGLFFMISRKKAIGQIIGFLVIENGMFTAAVLTTFGMPMIIEIGMFFDLLAAVLVMGILVFKINENFDSIDINKLKKLRG